MIQKISNITTAPWFVRKFQHCRNWNWTFCTLNKDLGTPIINSDHISTISIHVNPALRYISAAIQFCSSHSILRSRNWYSRSRSLSRYVCASAEYGKLLLVFKTGSSFMCWMRQVATSVMPDWYNKRTVYRCSEIRSRGCLAVPVLYSNPNCGEHGNRQRGYGPIRHSRVTGDREPGNRYGCFSDWFNKRVSVLRHLINSHRRI